MMAVATVGIVSTSFIAFLLCFCFYLDDVRAQSPPPPSIAPVPALAPAPGSIGPQTLLIDEIAILKTVDAKLNVGWNFSANPCTYESPSWNLKPDRNLREDKREFDVRSLTCGDCDANNNNCHVIDILLKSQNPTGVLPPELTSLKSLLTIDFTRNYINGSIPKEWGSFTRLLNISIGGNRLSGPIPEEIGNIASLKSLVLENNLLQGPIPKTLGRLTNLTRLLIGPNLLTGELPDSFGNLTYLEDLRLDGNEIVGKIPHSIGNLTNLKKLHLQGTSLEGPFPSTFSNLTKLFELRVTDFRGDGSFPPLLNMTSMKTLVLRNCSITGKLPNYLGTNMSLSLLDFSFNDFNGGIPESFGSWTSHSPPIIFLCLANNRLSGTIPDWIFDRKEHMNIDISYNSFTPSSALHDCYQNGDLNTVASCSSSEENSISPCLRKNYPCQDSAILNHKLFINCGGGKVNDGENEYDDDPSRPGKASFFLHGSRKWASSNTGDFFFHNYETYIAKNTSPINARFPKLYMEGRRSASSLKYYGLCMQNGNYDVKLHFAEIMFADGDTYYSVGRRYFDVSVQGRKVLKDFNIVETAKGTGRENIQSFNANVENNTLEIHFQWAGRGTNSIPEKDVYGPLISAISVTPRFNIDPEKKFPRGAIIGIAVASFAVVVVLILVIFWFLKIKTVKENEEITNIKLHTSYFTLGQIKTFTKNFNPENFIGQGGFGPVYKGALPDGTLVAVKRLSSMSKQGSREFVNEVGMISGLRHPNLVTLIGCCTEGDQLILVYEYMENNSLGRVLFGSKENRLILNWETRCNICLGAAKGLAYLHDECRLKIVHRDIKATNILLDKDLNAKISDFGLAKLDDEQNTHISTRIAGTRGYMAPEYATRGHLSDKADVYSFGVVMLEIISGRNSITRRPGDSDEYLVDWALSLQEFDNVDELVDPNLGSNYVEEDAKAMLKLALECCSTSPALRPTMSMIISILESGEPLSVPSAKDGKKQSKLGSVEEFPTSEDWNEISEATAARRSSSVSSMLSYDVLQH